MGLFDFLGDAIMAATDDMLWVAMDNAEGAWYDAMTDMNPGQIVLAEEVGLPVTAEYLEAEWPNVNRADFMDAVFGAHEAMEQALSATTNYVWGGIAEARQELSWMKRDLRFEAEGEMGGGGGWFGGGGGGAAGPWSW